MEEKIQVVEAVYERDIDFLLVEEFSSDLNFYRYFLHDTKIPAPESLSHVNVLRSKSDDDGEIDIFVKYTIKGKSIILLIENKIDASFQKHQAERYLKRKETYEGNVITFLVAPKAYLEIDHKFENKVSYESLIPYFETIGLRGKHKIKLLEIAIDKLRRGYIALNDDNRLRFNLAYWQCVGEFKAFNMDKPRIVPSKSSWIKLSHASLPDLKLYHKLSKHLFDIEIPKVKADNYKPLIDKAKELNKLIEFKSVYYIRTKLEVKFDEYLTEEDIQNKIRSVLKLFSAEIKKVVS